MLSWRKLILTWLFDLMPRSVVGFLVPTFLLTYGLMFHIISHGGIRTFGLPYLILIMWIPGAVSVAFRVWTKSGFEGAALKNAAGRFFIIAIAVPLLLALSSNLIGSAFGICHFGRIPDDILARTGSSSFTAFLAKRSLPLIILGLFGALGEQLGWRGYLLPELFRAKISRPLLISGIIWGLWHAPLVIWGGYYSVDRPLAIFSAYMLCTIGLGFIIGWVRIGSVGGKPVKLAREAREQLYWN